MRRHRRPGGQCRRPKPGGFDELDDAAWEQAFSTPLLMSAVRLIRAALPACAAGVAAPSSRLTSSAVREPDNFLLLSGVLRSGVAALMKALVRPLAADGVRINTLMPGIIKTDRILALAQARAKNHDTDVETQLKAMQAPIPLGRFGETEEFGRAAAFRIYAPAASYITGSTLMVDGGSLKAL